MLFMKIACEARQIYFKLSDCCLFLAIGTIGLVQISRETRAKIIIVGTIDCLLDDGGGLFVIDIIDHIINCPFGLLL